MHSLRLTPYALRLAAVLLVAMLAGCGFQMRGSATLPYDTLHITNDRTSPFASELKRTVARSSKTRIVDKPQDAQATLIVVDDVREKAILSLSGGGRVREYQLRYRVSYRLIDSNKRELRPRTQIQLSRDLSYNDNDTLAKESEELLLYRDMQTDAVSQLLRQLQTPQATQRGASL